jgi:hypothetical protein
MTAAPELRDTFDGVPRFELLELSGEWVRAFLRPQREGMIGAEAAPGPLTTEGSNHG